MLWDRWRWELLVGGGPGTLKRAGEVGAVGGGEGPRARGREGGGLGLR